MQIGQIVHKLRAKAFYDKVKEENSTQNLFSFDCEKILNMFKVSDQVAYYLRNVYSYNFTIVEGSSKSKSLQENVNAYFWTENVYPKAANQIASVVYHCWSNTNCTTCEKVRLIAES